MPGTLALANRCKACFLSCKVAEQPKQGGRCEEVVPMLRRMSRGSPAVHLQPLGWRRPGDRVLNLVA